MKDIFKISPDQVFVRDPTSELSSLLLSLGWSGETMLELQWAGTVLLRKPKKKGAEGPDQCAREPPTGCGLVGPGVSRVKFLTTPATKGLLFWALISVFLPSLQVWNSQFKVGLREAVPGWFLTSRPRRECWSLGLLFSALVFFPEPSPRGGGGRLHIWVLESAGMR